MSLPGHAVQDANPDTNLPVIRDVLSSAAGSVKFKYETGCVCPGIFSSIFFFSLLCSLGAVCFLLQSLVWLSRIVFFPNIDPLWGKVLSFPKGCVYQFMALDCHVLREAKAVKWHIAAKTKYEMYFCVSLARHCVPRSEQCHRLNGKSENQELLSSCFYYWALSLHFLALT